MPEYTGPAENIFPRVPGTDVGVIGGIPTDRSNLINVTQAPYNADNTGATDARAAIQAAIDAATTNDVVYLPTGTYRINSSLLISNAKDNITLRGDGPTLTTIDDRTTDYCIQVGSSGAASDYNWQDQRYAVPTTGNMVTAGLTQGSTELTIADTTDFLVGALIQIALSNQWDNTEIDNGAVPTVSVAGYETLRRQLTRVVSKTSTVLTIFPAVHYTPDSNLIAKVNYRSAIAEGVGIEDLYIDQTNGLASIIYFQGGVNCWVKNVKTYKATNYPVIFENSINCEVRKCDLRSNKTENTSSNAGVLMNTVANSLIEDNIIYRIFPCIEINSGCEGNVIGYNFLYNEIGACLDTNHGPHNSLNLHEGNITTTIKSDGYFGSQSNDTYFRNWITADQFETDTNAFPVSLCRFTRENALVGNILGAAGWPYANDPGWVYGTVPYGLGGSPFGSPTDGTCQPSLGDFWVDWKMTGTLSTRTSDTAGVITVSTIGQITTSNFITVWWSSRAQNGQFQASSIAGNDLTFSGFSGSAVLPAQGSSFEVYTGSGGYNELDYDVYRTNDPTHAGSTTVKANYWATDGHEHIPSGTTGGETDESLGGDTLADSWYDPDGKTGLESRGVVWGNLAYPPFDSSNPGDLSEDGWQRLPAGYRYVNGDDPPSGNAVSTGISGLATISGTVTIQHA